MSLDFPASPTHGQTYTNPSVGTVYTYVGNNPSGYWRVTTAVGSGQASKADVNAGTDNTKYVTPFAMSDVIDLAQGARMGLTRVPSGGEVGEIISMPDHYLYAENSNFSTGSYTGIPLIAPATGVFRIEGDCNFAANYFRAASGAGYGKWMMFSLSDLLIFYVYVLDEPLWVSAKYSKNFSISLGYLTVGQQLDITINVNGNITGGISNLIIYNVNFVRIA